MKKTLRELKELYRAYYMVQKKSQRNELAKKYKAAKDSARFVWICRVRPAVDKFLNAGEER